MKTHLRNVIAALSLFLPTLGGMAADPPAADDQQNIQGTWIVVTASEDGRVLTEVPDQMVFAGDQLTMSDKSGKEKKGAFRVDPTQNPKVLIFPKEHAPNVIPTTFAYELNGDALKIVISRPNRKPTDLSDQGQLLFILKRQKQ